MLGNIWRRWSWLEAWGVSLAEMLVYLAWVYPLFSLLIDNLGPQRAVPGFTPWLCLGVLTGAALCGWLARENPFGAVIVVVGGITAILVSLAWVVPPAAVEAGQTWFGTIVSRVQYGAETEIIPLPLILPFCVAFLWWRGLRIGSADHDEAAWWFVVGVVALACTLLFSLVLSSEGGPGSLVGWVVLFLAAGSITLARLGVPYALRSTARPDGGLRMDAHWLVAVVSVFVAILIIGAVISQLVAPSTVLRVIGWLQPVWRLISQAALFVIAILSYLLFLLLEPLMARLQNRSPEPVARPTVDFSLKEELQAQAVEGTWEISPVWGQVAKVLLLLGVLAAVVYVFVLALRRQRNRFSVQGEPVETRELVWSWSLVRDQAVELLGARRSRKIGTRFLDLGASTTTRRVVRKLYQELLAQALDLGLPRQAGQTPSDYADTLLHICPEEEEALSTLTATYAEARYSLVPPTAEQAELATEAFRHIQGRLAMVKQDELK